MTKFEEYLEAAFKIKDDKSYEKEGKVTVEKFEFEDLPIDEKTGIAKAVLIKMAHKNKPMRYIDIVKMLQEETMEKRKNLKKPGSVWKFNSVKDRGFGSDAIRKLKQKWLVKVDKEGKVIEAPGTRSFRTPTYRKALYIINPKRLEQVKSGKFKPYAKTFR